MKPILFGIFGLLFHLPLLAVPLAGKVSLFTGGVFIQRVGETESKPLKAFTMEAQRTLERLTQNDFLQGEAELRDGVWFLTSVDFVGLYHLLGSWQSADGANLFTFEDYDKFTIFTPRTLGFDRAAVFSYSLTPALGNIWRIFVSGSRSVSIASLKIESKQLTLQFINMDTGKYERPLVLLRKSPGSDTSDFGPTNFESQ